MANAGDKISILIVDDKEDKLVSLEAVLNDLDLNIVRALSGREALRCVLQQDFAAILLDVNMPGMDGFETASLIRERKNSQDTPILFITAFGDEPFVTRGYALGAVDYILTPVNPDVLRTKVAVFVELYRKNLQVRQQAEKLELRANQLAALAAEVTEAEQRERRRLAAILHDNLQQMLVAAKMRIGLLERATPADGQIISQVDSLLDQSIEASRSLTLELSPPILFDANLGAALSWLARQMKEKHGLTVLIDADDTGDGSESIKAFLFQSVRELLFNIVKHAGVSQARVSASRLPGDRMLVVVEDNGGGFNPAMLETMNSRAEHFGLFSIRERVRLMNGKMTIDSSVNRGTRIAIELPYAAAISTSPTPPKVDAPATTMRPSLAESPVEGSARIRVVIADDHDILRKGLAALLSRQSDLELVGEAADGHAAIELARRVRPDVIVMDIAMPGMTGIEATRCIKRELPDTRVVGLSMHTKEDMAAAMRLAGAAAYLSKGGPPEALIAEIRNGMPTRPKAPTHVETDSTHVGSALR